MGFWSELTKSFKERTEQSKEWKQSMEDLEKLKDSEHFKKTKESVEALKEKSAEELKKKAEQLGETLSSGGEKLKSTASNLSEGLSSTLGTIKDKTGIDQTLQKTKESLDQAKQKIDQVSEGIQRAGESIRTTAEQSRLYQGIKAQIPKSMLGEDKKEDQKLLEGGDSSQSAPKSGLIVRTEAVQSAVEQRLKELQARLRASRPYQTALVIKEKIVESDNPIIQRALDYGDAVSRVTRKFVGENERAKTLKLIKQLDPAFTPADFLNNMATTVVPRLRAAMLRGDSATLSAFMSPRVPACTSYILLFYSHSPQHSLSLFLSTVGRK